MPKIITSIKCDEDYNILSNAQLPDEYKQLSELILDRQISEAKTKLKQHILILGHHYQRDEIIKFADYRGDSLKLAQCAAKNQQVEFIIFCGVHFMAESADILTNENQKVILPNLEAGCSMADMANIGQVNNCWDELAQNGITNIIPITYMNSTADLKAFVGKNGGAVCTSSNARAILTWALNQNKKILFFPDQHLGRITAVSLGIPLSDMIIWDPFQYMGGQEPNDFKKAKIILWKGHCAVHARFKLEQIQQARHDYSEVRVIVHPECTLDVIQAADEYGSTEYIYKRISESPSGAIWAVGTEINLVNRLAQNMPDKTIFCLDPVVCPCSTMYRIHPSYLCWVLENLLEGNIINRIQVPENIKYWSKIALQRMLDIF